MEYGLSLRQSGGLRCSLVNESRPQDDAGGCHPNFDKFDFRPKPTSATRETRAMAADKETHIATLQDARSSCYFGCDMHGEERP